MKIGIVVGLLSALIAGAAPAAAAVKIKVGEETIPLPHIEGVRLERADGTAQITLFFAESKPLTKLVLVDEFGNDELPLGAWSSNPDAMAARLSFQEGDLENYSLNLYVGQDSVAVGGHRSGDAGSGAFSKLDLKKDAVRGTLELAAPQATLDGTFDTPLTVIKEPVWVSGAAVMKSPQGQVLLAYATAMRKLDFAAATKHSVRDEAAETGPLTDPGQKARLLNLMQMEFGKNAKEFETLLSSHDASMAESPTATKIRITRRDGSFSETSTIGLMKVDGAWKVNY